MAGHARGLGVGHRGGPHRGRRPHAGHRLVRALTIGSADVLVVGAGAIGLSAALALRDRGAAVRVLERGAPGGGQSAGPGRIFRHIHRRADVAALAARARRAWREAEDRFGGSLLDDRGTLLVGDPSEPRAALEAAGVPCETLDGEGLRRAMPALSTDHGEGLLDPGGGTIDAERYVAALAAELADALVPAEVDSVSADGPVVSVGGERLAADAVLVCAGAGTPALARAAGIDVPIRATTHRRVSFIGGPSRPLPCLLERSGLHGATGYGTPLPGGGFALGSHSADDLAPEEAIARTTAYLRSALPGLDAEPTAIVRCTSTALAGDTDAFGLYTAGRVALLAGGNLFKHAPVLGPMLADAVLDGRVDPVLLPPGDGTLGEAGVAER